MEGLLFVEYRLFILLFDNRFYKRSLINICSFNIPNNNNNNNYHAGQNPCEACIENQLRQLPHHQTHTASSQL